MVWVRNALEKSKFLYPKISDLIRMESPFQEIEGDDEFESGPGKCRDILPDTQVNENINNIPMLEYLENIEEVG